jgi:hypothetical protein
MALRNAFGDKVLAPTAVGKGTPSKNKNVMAGFCLVPFTTKAAPMSSTVHEAGTGMVPNAYVRY